MMMNDRRRTQLCPIWPTWVLCHWLQLRWHDQLRGSPPRTSLVGLIPQICPSIWHERAMLGVHALRSGNNCRGAIAYSYRMHIVTASMGDIFRLVLSLKVILLRQTTEKLGVMRPSEPPLRRQGIDLIAFGDIAAMDVFMSQHKRAAVDPTNDRIYCICGLF
jgi:hypothetical protein